MTYSNQLSYGPQQQPLQYNQTGMNYKKPSATSIAVGGALLGGIAGGGYGIRKGYSLDSYISKNGKVVDSFAVDIFEKHINASTNDLKESYNEGLNILNKIKSIKKPEELKQLLEANPKAANNLCKDLNQSLEDYIVNITVDNLEANKKSIKDKITSGNNAHYQNMKNQIQACWDKNKKKFVKNENVPNDLFDIIEKTTNKFNWKKMGKFAAIGTAITGIVTFIAAKLLIK